MWLGSPWAPSRPQKPHLPGGYKPPHCVYHRLGGCPRPARIGAGWSHIASPHSGHNPKRWTLSSSLTEEDTETQDRCRSKCEGGTERSDGTIHDREQSHANKMFTLALFMMTLTWKGPKHTAAGK